MASHALPSLARHAKSPMQFHPAHAIARHAEKINRVKPDLEAGAGLVKDGASAGRDMRAAMGALKFLTVGDAMESGIDHATGRASMAKAKPDLHHVFKANILV